MNSEPVRVEMLYFEGCPTTVTMREYLREAVAELGNELVFAEVDLESLPRGDERRGFGSPTVLVDGVDLMGQGNPGATELSCRIYSEGVPSAGQIAALLETALR